MAEQAIVFLQKILEATDKNKSKGCAAGQKSSTLTGDKPRGQGRETSLSQAQHAGTNSLVHNSYNHTNEHSTLPPAKRHCNRSHSAHTMLPADATTTSSVVSQCLECEVKDAEIHTLRRRIQLLEEQVAKTPPQSHAGVPLQVSPAFYASIQYTYSKTSDSGPSKIQT